MARRRRSPLVLVVVVGAVAVIGALLFLVRARREPSRAARAADGGAEQTSLPRFTDPAHPHDSPSGHPTPPHFTPPVVVSDARLDLDAEIGSAIARWRAAILGYDAESVERLHETFKSEPEFFRRPLMDLAEHDAEPRIRSFSTRVLGNMKAVEAIPLLRRLLTDKSQYVRYNAAWALGELADRPSVPALRKLERTDPDREVRQSATEARKKLE